MWFTREGRAGMHKPDLLGLSLNVEKFERWHVWGDVIWESPFQFLFKSSLVTNANREFMFPVDLDLDPAQPLTGDH